jgi:hypothetical protein
MFVSNQGLQIVIDLMSLDYNENKDIISIVIDVLYVLQSDQLLNTGSIMPRDDLSILLTRLGIFDGISPLI